jgi:hypothetical protein
MNFSRRTGAVYAALVSLTLSAPAYAANLAVTFEFGSPTYPAGTTQIGDNDVEFVSDTDSPLGPFSGQSVHFLGRQVGGDVVVYRYPLEFDQAVQLHSIVVSGAAWLPLDEISLLDVNEIELVSVNAPLPPQGTNSFQDVVLDATGIVGDTFFLEEVNDDQAWRYRSNIAAALAGRDFPWSGTATLI